VLDVVDVLVPDVEPVVQPELDLEPESSLDVPVEEVAPAVDVVPSALVVLVLVVPVSVLLAVGVVPVLVLAAVVAAVWA
jgi:hypothetical protein